MPLTPEQIIADLRRLAKRYEEVASTTGEVKFDKKARSRCEAASIALHDAASHYARGELMAKD
jgi:hypothetical protein